MNNFTLVTFFLIGIAMIFGVCPAQAYDVLVGVNVVDVNKLNDEKQDALIESLHKAGVKIVRLGIANERSNRFVSRAFSRGIRSVLILSPTEGATGKHIRPADKSRNLTWREEALSDCDPDGFRDWFRSKISPLEDAGVVFAAFECGNELNSTDYNGDFSGPKTGRFLGLSDLNNADDPEAAAVANGFRAYLKVLSELKRLRDHSKLNRQTPILSAGMVTMGQPKHDSRLGKDGVTNAATIEYMRAHGLDEIVDGYGVHTYPSSDPKRPPALVAQALEKDTFATNSNGGKPCWITEWGFDNNDPTCPLADDEARKKIIQRERGAFREFAKQGRLAAIIYFSWNSRSWEKPGSSICRCDALTSGGEAALLPMRGE